MLKPVRIRRRWKVLAAGVMALFCIGMAFNIWFVQNTNAIIESLVSARSDGRIQLQLEKSSFQYLKKRIILRGATFYANDTSGARTAYQFHIPRLDLKIRSFWSFFVYRELLLDSMTLRSPVVTVTRLTKATKEEKAGVSVPEEIGRIYNSILDALEVLQVKRFQIDDGRFNLVNKTAPQQPVTTISNIHFHLNNLNINSDSAAAHKFLYSDNVELRVNDQDIMLPDGIHRISFKNLLINVGRRQVQLDSCWVKAETRNDRNAFRIFFDVLKMTNLDFAALYRRNEIKADSVYVDNPDINIALELKRKREQGKKLELDTIIQQFTGDLNLGFIGVQNAAVNIVANRNDTATTFSSTNDNFKMFGLRINSDSTQQPVHVDEFAMILRNYETYSRDSSAVYRFDSLRFNNNKVRLSNFTIKSISNQQGKSSLNYSIPAFELTGLSWEDLLFDRYISAERAVLVRPYIQYTVGTVRRKGDRLSLFRILSGLNETIDLRTVEIQDGTLNLQFAPGKQLNLQHVNLGLASNKLLASTSYTGMKQAITALALRNAVFTTGNLRAELLNLRYADKLYADALRVTSLKNRFQAEAKGISLNDLVWNNQEKSVFVDGLGWQQGTIMIRKGGPASFTSSNAMITLNNVHGMNTTLTVFTDGAVFKTNLERIKIDELVKKRAATAVVNGLVLDGRSMDATTATFQVKSGSYHFIDNGASNIQAVALLQQSPNDTIRVAVPQAFFKTGLQKLLNGNLHLDDLTAHAPVFDITSLPQAAVAVLPAKTGFPAFAIDRCTLLNPQIRYLKKDSAHTTLEWSGTDATDACTFYNFRALPLQGLMTADAAHLDGSTFVVTRNSKRMGIDSGRVQLALQRLNLNTKGGLQWKAFVQHALFQNPIPLLLNGQASLQVAEVQAKDLQLSSGNIQNIYQLLKQNPQAQLMLRKGQYATAKSFLQWQGVRYQQNTRSLAIDSFGFRPTLSRDSFIAQAPGQVDYIHGVLKKVTIAPLDLDAWEHHAVVAAHHITIDSSELHIYRDKQKPFIAGKLRPLPVLALQNLPLKLDIDSVTLNNSAISYTEKSAKTGQEGAISLNRIHAQLFPVRNIGLDTHDSLTLSGEGYLMDRALLKLRLREAYTDSLGTFAMTLRMPATDVTFLNAMLVPVTSVKILSGAIDTVSMTAIGNDHFSVGAMQLYYNNLKVQFLTKGSETKKSFLTGLITFAANNFVIRKNNDHRTGTVYFLRNRDRSVFNFLIKTALSGVASSVGAKRNKTYNRQYKRQQKLYRSAAVNLG